MDDKQLQAVKEKIESEIAKTTATIADYRSMVQPVSPDNAIGRVSRMDAINNKAVAEAALRQAEDKLMRLQIMLTKVAEPNFGKCARCGSPIPLARLLLMPQSNFCVNCAR